MTATPDSDPSPTRLRALLPGVLPGVLLSAAIALLARLVAAAETRLFGHAVVEALVLAILLGMLARAALALPAAVEPGVAYSAKQLLETAVFLLGASVDLPLLLAAGPALAVGIVALVVVGLAASYAIGRALRLPHRLAVLVACGNSICGNSAIAAVAPVIGAEKSHVASSIAFTAILGVLVVLGLPMLIGPLALSDYQYGVLAGLTVYAVPQVVAASFPVSALAGEVGTLVKLVRVLMLGPVVLFFAVTHRHATAAARSARFEITRWVPWFILGFLALAALRSLGLVPAALVAPARALSGWLMIVAMAALGLGVDLAAVRRVGRPVAVTVTLSLVGLVLLAVLLIRLLGIR